MLLSVNLTSKAEVVKTMRTCAGVEERYICDVEERYICGVEEGYVCDKEEICL